jgi:acyl-homoserine lactone acylase PvdQ
MGFDLGMIFKRLALLPTVALCLVAAVDPRSVTIYRDSWGVPHIYARTDAGAAYGLMYAQAEDNFRQLETDYIRALGRAAEAEGRRGLSGDILYRAYEVEPRARAAYATAGPEIRALCDAFSDGVNRYLATHPDVKPRLLTRWEPWFILAYEMRGPAGAGITAEERARVFPLPADTSPGDGSDAGPDADEGSNMWAIAPSRSATGHAMLLINPHIGFFGSGQRYEAHLHSAEGLDVSGFAMLGTPYIRSGHNSYLGWSHTNNYASTADVYLEPLTGGTEWTEDIRIKTDLGVETRRVTFRKTKHGPVLGIRGDRALSVRAVAPAGGVMEQRWAMARARNLREFQAAMARTALTGSNTIYADREGNIWYVHGNAIPRRSTKFDWTKPVDGADPETEWRGLHKLSELPQVLNPKSGWLQNCNSTPFLTTDDAEDPRAVDYPAYMAPEPDTPRSSRSRAILAGTRRFSFAEWSAAAMDTKVGIAERKIPELLAAYHAAPRPALAELVAELEHWDQVARIDSVGATLFLRSANSADILTGLEKTKAALESAWGTWRVPWGEVNRLQRVQSDGTEEPFSDSKPSVPVPGAPSFSGTIFTFGTREAPGQKRAYGVIGDSYVAVVEFGRTPLTRSLLVNGESADSRSPHYIDQAGLYSAGRFKDAWFALKEIRRHVERKYTP